MKTYKVQTLTSLRDEMKPVARGERKAPRDAARLSLHSVGAMTRLLTSDNRMLLAIIRDARPGSVAALAGIW
jgi:predicted transcriptional regulator